MKKKYKGFIKLVQYQTKTDNSKNDDGKYLIRTKIMSDDNLTSEKF